MTDDRPYLNLKLRAADVLRLQAGDIVILNISRPLATSETEKLAEAWRVLMAAHGLGATVDLVVMSGVDVDLKVLRNEEAVTG